MLAREKRLLSARDFKRAYQKGSFFGSSFFNLSILPNRTQNTRLGFVIGKKVDPHAVKRNLYKRRLREAARGLYEFLPAGYDVVVNIKPSVKGASFEAIKRELSEAFKKVGTLPAKKGTHSRGGRR